MSISNELREKYHTLLLSEQIVAKELGIPKKAVQELISSGALRAVEVSGKALVPILSLASMLGERETVDFGQQNTVLQSSEELSCVLTNSRLVQDIHEEATDMVYTGAISTLKDGRFMVQINKGKKADGSRDRESKGFRDKTQAQKYLDNRLAQLNTTNSVQMPTDIAMGRPYTVAIINAHTYTDKTFEEYAIDTLNGGVGKATSRTIDGYRESLYQVVKHIGNEKMVDIGEVQLRKMFEKLSHYYAKSSLKKSFVTTKMIFDVALSKEDIPSTPFAKLKCPTSKKIVDKEMEAYTDDQIKTILLEAKNYHNPILYPIFAVCECTGIRPGELRALEWTRFNPEEKTLAIRQAISKEYEKIERINQKTKSKEFVSITKSRFGVRTLRLSDLAVQALLDWRKVLDDSPAPMKNSKFIFPSQEGDYKKESSVKCLMQRFVKKVGIEDMGLTLYRFRHTMCTRLILAGQPIPVIQRIMGDNTIDVIMKIYTHVTEKQAMAACESYYDNLNQRHKENEI
jgi:integrase